MESSGGLGGKTELVGTQAGEEAGNTHSVAGGREKAQHTEIVGTGGAVVGEATGTFTVGGLAGTPKNITALVEHGNGIEGQSEVEGDTHTEIVGTGGAVVGEATGTFTGGGLEGTPKNITALVEHGNGIEGQSEVEGDTHTGIVGTGGAVVGEATGTFTAVSYTHLTLPTTPYV